MNSSYTVIWNGTKHRQDEEAYTLLPDFPAQKDSFLVRCALTGHDREGLPGAREMKRAKLEPSNMAWRTYDPHLAPKDYPHPQKVRCKGCGRYYKTRIPAVRRLCGSCRGKVGRPKAA